MKKYDLTEKDIEHDLKWLEKPNNTLHDYGDLVRHLLNEVEELKLNKNMNENMKTIAQQLNVTKFPFTIMDSNGNKIYFEEYNKWWIKYEYDSNGNNIYHEASDGFWTKYEYDSNGNEIYFENSCGTIRDNRNTPEESPEESLHMLIKDNVVLEATRQFGCSLTRDIMKIVLNGNTMTDEYYSKLMDVTNVINKQCGMHFTVTVKYEYE